MRNQQSRDHCETLGRLLTAVGLLVGLAYSTALGADSLYLQQVQSDVIAHNDRVAAARFMEQAATARGRSMGAWSDPMVMVGVANLPTSFDFKEDPMTMTMVGLSQQIPLSGEKGMESRAGEAEALVATEDRRAMELDLARAARVAFIDLLYGNTSLSDLYAQYQLLDLVTASARTKLATQQGSQEEVLAAEAESWRLEVRILEAQHMLDEARYNLNLLRGVAVDSTLPPLAAPVQDTLPETPDPWLTAARAHYPPLQKLQRQSEALSYSSSAAGRARWPMLGLSANYGFRYSTEVEKRSDMVGFQATLSLPIFSGGKQGQSASSMTAMRESTDWEALGKWREVEARLRLLHTIARHLQQSIKIYEDRIIPASQDAFQSALSGYAGNRLPFTSLLSYAGAIYRDRLSKNQMAAELERTFAEIESFIVDPAIWESPEPSQTP